jgi:hypothetical protein
MIPLAWVVFAKWASDQWSNGGVLRVLTPLTGSLTATNDQSGDYKVSRKPDIHIYVFWSSTPAYALIPSSIPRSYSGDYDAAIELMKVIWSVSILMNWCHMVRKWRSLDSLELSLGSSQVSHDGTEDTEDPHKPFGLRRWRHTWSELSKMWNGTIQGETC